MSDGNQRMSLRVYQYRRNRRNFAMKVYCIAIIFIIVTVLQWLPMILVEDFRTFFIEKYYVSMIFLLLALFCVSIFVFLENVRFLSPVNCLLAVLIVELSTFGLVRIVVSKSFLVYGASAGVTAGTVLIFLGLGILISHDLTLDVVILFLCSVIFFIGSVFFMMLYLTAGVTFSIYVYSGFVILAVVSFIMYHAQTINGSRYAEMRLNDYWLAALIIYHDFVILYVVYYNIFYHSLGQSGSQSDKKITTKSADIVPDETADNYDYSI